MSTPDDKTLIEELERLAGEAGRSGCGARPWTVEPDPTERRTSAVRAQYEYDPGEWSSVWMAREMEPAEAALMAFSRNNLPRLLSLAKIGVEATEALTSAECVLREVRDQFGGIGSDLNLPEQALLRRVRTAIPAIVALLPKAPQPQPAEETKP